MKLKNENDIIFNSKETGELKLDRVLFETFEPILFVCKNSVGELYICVCCMSTGKMKKWLIAKIVPQIIISMLKNEITIRDAFLSGDANKRYSVNGIKKCNVIINDTIDWDSANSKMLPTAGEYIDAEENEFIKEIEHYTEYKDLIF